MQTSGLLLDVYDDHNGDQIRSFFPALESVPGFVKEAHALTSDERHLLPDDAYALVLVDEGERLRKYACTDAGNTALSVAYFLENGHKLPEEAQKVAASNLSTACGWYGIEAPVLEKIAIVGWAARQAVKHPFTALNVAMSGEGLAHAAHDVGESNRAIDAIRAAEGGTIGGRPISPQEISELRGKHAELAGTHTMPTSKASVSPTPSKTVVVKSAAMRPHVDVTGKEAVKTATVKPVKQFALGDKYPLDSYEQVKTAGAYFTEFGRRFSPEDRREYCLNFVKRAEALSIPVSDDARRYGAESYATDEEIKVAFDLRKGLVIDEELLPLLDRLYEKRAEIEPELFATTLAEFDKLAGIDFAYDQEIPDPYYSVFGKVAEEEFREVIGNDVVTGENLCRLARNGIPTLKSTFGEDFVGEFRKDPVGIFKSLPRDQKIVIMRLASDNTDLGTGV